MQETFEQFTASQDDRYCYVKVSSPVFDKLKETAKEHQIGFIAKQTDDGDFVIRAAQSEKEYLAKAVA